MDRRSERRDYRNSNDNCEDRQSRMSTSPAAPVEIVVHREHLPNENQRSRAVPVPLVFCRPGLRSRRPSVLCSVRIGARNANAFGENPGEDRPLDLTCLKR